MKSQQKMDTTKWCKLYNNVSPASNTTAFLDTPRKSNMEPENIPLEVRKIIFQTTMTSGSIC